MKNSRKKFLCLFLALILSISMVTSVFADAVKVPNPKVLRENPPAYWQYGGSTSFNSTVRDAAAGALAGALVARFGGSTQFWKDAAYGFLGALGVTVFTGTYYVEKSVYYKLNYNGNGYPYYVHEIFEFYDGGPNGEYLYSTDKYFYSTQPY